MRILYFILLFSLSRVSFAEYFEFKGSIATYPITLILEAHSDGFIRASYVYDKYDTPIVANGVLKNDTMTLWERDKNEVETATFRFYNCHLDSSKLHGFWSLNGKKKQLNVALVKTLEFELFDDNSFHNIELGQSESNPDHYFKVLISKEQDRAPDVTGIRIYEKGSDLLIQEIDVNCQFRGVNALWVDDYNFDSIPDFQIFEASYMGPNTSSLYFLWQPDSEKYIKAEFSGTSLTFDHEKKRVYSHNQSGAGRYHYSVTYRVEGNKTVIEEEHCYEYSEEEEDLIEVDCN